MDKSRLPSLFQSCVLYFHVTSLCCISSFSSFILPCRLDKVLTFKGTVEAGPFQCDNREVLFHNSCFSKDNSRMVTYFSDELMVWNISSGERERTLDFPVPLLLCRSLQVVITLVPLIKIAFYRLRCIQQFSLVTSAKCFSNARVVRILCAYEQNSWFCSVDDRMIQIVKNNLAVEQDSRDIRDIVIPINLYSSQELNVSGNIPNNRGFQRFLRTVTHTIIICIER